MVGMWLRTAAQLHFDTWRPRPNLDRPLPSSCQAPAVSGVRMLSYHCAAMLRIACFGGASFTLPTRKVRPRFGVKLSDVDLLSATWKTRTRFGNVSAGEKLARTRWATLLCFAEFGAKSAAEKLATRQASARPLACPRDTRYLGRLAATLKSRCQVTQRPRADQGGLGKGCMSETASNGRRLVREGGHVACRANPLVGCVWVEGTYRVLAREGVEGLVAVKHAGVLMK